MEWKKSNISQSELEKQQQAYIKEALEMAKRSVASQFEKAAEMEKAKVEREAAEKAEAERIAAEKVEAERVAAEKAEAERIAAEKAKAERVAAEKAEAERIAAEKAEAERAAAEKAKAESEKLKEELTSFAEPEEDTTDCKPCSDECLKQSDKDCVIDIEEVKKTMSAPEKQDRNQAHNQERAITQNNTPNRKQGNPPNFNRYINEHNKNQCNCPNCQRRRAEQQR